MTPSSRTWPILAPFLLLRAAIVSRESVPTASWTVEWLLPTVRLSFPLRWVPESYSIRPIHDLWRLRGAPNCATASHSRMSVPVCPYITIYLFLDRSSAPSVCVRLLARYIFVSRRQTIDGPTDWGGAGRPDNATSPTTHGAGDFRPLRRRLAP